MNTLLFLWNIWKRLNNNRRGVAGMRIPIARVDKERDDSTASAILATFHSMVESTQINGIFIPFEKLG